MCAHKIQLYIYIITAPYMAMRCAMVMYTKV